MSGEEFITKAWEAILEYWFLIASIITTVYMAMMRTARKDGKVDWVESTMCALFSYGVFLILSWLNIPEEASVLIGAFIGYMGTHKMSSWTLEKFGWKPRENEQEEEE